MISELESNAKMFLNSSKFFRAFLYLFVNKISRMRLLVLLIILLFGLSCAKSDLQNSELAKNQAKLDKAIKLNQPKYFYRGSDAQWHYLDFAVREKSSKKYKVSKKDLLFDDEFDKTNDRSKWVVIMTRDQNLHWTLNANQFTISQKYIPIISTKNKEYLISVGDYVMVKNKENIRENISKLNIPKISFISY